MAEITATLVSKLRERTGVGMMECKKALIETNGNLDTAVDVLRKKGIATAASKAGRTAKEGLIAQHILPGSRAGILVEVNCVTDFVARNDQFKAFTDDVARRLLADPNTDFEAERAALVTKTGENIQIARHRSMTVTGNGMVAAYIHTGAKVGVLVEVGAGQEASVSHEDFRQFVRDITLQVAAASPIAVSRDQVDPAVIAKEREIAAEQVKNKPPQAIAKIIEGKLDKYFQTVCLIDQGFLKKNSEVSVKEHMASLAKQLGDEIVIRRFIRFQVGETAA